MIELTLAEVASIVGGRLRDGTDPGGTVTGSVEFDSRQIGPGGLFVAVAGERHDGHDFARAAITAGAVAVVATRPVGVASIEVPDALTALADLAREVLRRLPQAIVIAITGSSGKTSTKDLLAQVLAHAGPTVAPPGSFNNELGHPYTVLRADRDTRFLITETSARGIGHIRYLTEIAPPRIGVVLNVGSAHLGEFGSRAAIAQAKGELVEALPPAANGGVAILNGDDDAVRAMAARTPARVVLVGRGPDCAVRAQEVALDELGRPSFHLVVGTEWAEVRLQLSGEHQVANALASAAVALECGLSLAEVASALSAARSISAWRMQVIERPDGVVVINDAYNANPESVRAALLTLGNFVATRPRSRTWAVLGHMAELGEQAADAHLEAGRLVAALGISRLVVVGEQARPIVDGAVLEGWSTSAAGAPDWVPDTKSATRLLRDELRAGDVVLVKASRSAGLEQVALALIGEHTASGEQTANGEVAT
jgi:UDP-N-acetylmuramoyl-tripeptide--D-alanyl-D-alanine ligase